MGRNVGSCVCAVLLGDYRYREMLSHHWTQETTDQGTDWETDLELLAYGHRLSCRLGTVLRGSDSRQREEDA